MAGGLRSSGSKVLRGRDDVATPMHSRGYDQRRRSDVELSTLSFDSEGRRVISYLGIVSLHFIKESWAVRNKEELGSELQMFLMEVNALVRAHTAALGANALLCYTLVPEESSSKASRNQVYHMMSATGYAVVLEPRSAERLTQAVLRDPFDKRLRSQQTQNCTTSPKMFDLSKPSHDAPSPSTSPRSSEGGNLTATHIPKPPVTTFDAGSRSVSC